MGSSHNFFDLSGRTAVVTGASRGLGQYFGRALARAGADLVITARDAARCAEFKSEVESLGRNVVALSLDVRDQGSIEAFADSAMEAAGRIDILVNNAGGNVRKPAVDVTWDDWNLILDTNLRGMFFVSQAIATRSMIPNRYGRIVNVGSYTTVAGFAGLAPYSASRGGVRQMTMALADDWGVHGITVNCLSPGCPVRGRGVGGVPVRPYPAREAGAASRPRRGGGVPGVRRRRVRDRPEPADRRRHLDRCRARVAEGARLNEAARPGSWIKPRFSHRCRHQRPSVLSLDNL
jgi:NAD(P)-dependent dehydrogenase (short-subunit alcohol dehydrogenase family)